MNKTAVSVYHLITAFILFLSLLTPAYARYSGGTGSAADPYRIATPADLDDIKNHTEDFSASFILVNDIDMAGYTYTTALIAKNPIIKGPFLGKSFTGVFDGKGHKISNLTINTGGLNTYHLGLFGKINIGGNVKNLGIENYSITGGDASNFVGGLCGENRGTISQSYSSGAEIIGSYIGGLCGLNYGTITQSYSTGNVKGVSVLGGFCGLNNGNISNCYTTVGVTGDGVKVGAFCCSNSGTISNCFWDTQVTRMRVSGGGTGQTTAQMLSKNTYLNAGWDLVGETTNGSEDIWQISDGDYPSLSWQVISDAPVPDIIGVDIPQTEYALVAAGYRIGSIVYGYSSSISAGSIVSSIPQAGVYAVQGRAIHVVVSLGLCPYSGGGEGTPENPIKIANASDLFLLASNISDYDKCFILTANIDLDPNVTGVPAFNKALISSGTMGVYNYLGTSFTGIFDGNNHKIMNLTINTCGWRKTHLGLFGYILGEVKNLKVEDCSITGVIGSNYIGGLCGANSGIISRLCSSGNISGDSYIGGLCGYNNGTISLSSSASIAKGTYGVAYGVGGICGYNEFGTIAHCYASGNVTGQGRQGNPVAIGGLCGSSIRGIITNCYATGNVTGDYSSAYLGGLCGGSKKGIITNCYATGNVTCGPQSDFLGGLCGQNEDGTISNCYATGNVTGGSYLGGLCAYNEASTITNCYATGNITGGSNSKYLGGFCGYQAISPATIEKCYSTGKVTGTSYSGSFMGYLEKGILIDCFWDKQTSGMTEGIGIIDGLGSSIGIYDRTTEQMQQQKTFTDYGWDFYGETANGTGDIWFIKGIDYPTFCYLHRPVAKAGDDQRLCSDLTGYATITLDANSSTDPDGDALTYLWTWQIDANKYSAQGVQADIELPVGEYVITLVVNDGILDSEPDHVTVTVLPTAEFSMNLTPKTLNSGSSGKWVKAHFVLPAGYEVKDIDANIPLMMEPFGAESQYINVFVDDAGITCIETGFKRSSLAALGDFGPGKITVYGKLANGHCFAGVDSIRVIDRRVEKLGELSSRWLEQNCRPPGWCGGSDLNADGRVDFIDFALLDELFVEIRVE